MIKISIVGDIVCDKKMLKAAFKDNKYSFDEMFSPLNNYFKDSDYVIGNLESVISHKNYTNSTFSFCSPESLLLSLKKIGINAFSLSNNHILDRGEEGINSTIEIFNKNGIKYFGISNYLNIDLDDNKISILGYTDSTNYHINKINNNFKHKVNVIEKEIIHRKGKYLFKYYYKLSSETRIKIKKLLHRKIHPIVDNEVFDKKSINKIKKIVNQLKNNNRFVIMYPHIGGQYNIYPGKYTIDLVNEFNNIGCDSIIVTHPHIIQNVKNINNCFSIGDIAISPKSDYVLWDSLPQYSAILNYYFDNNRLKKMTLSFLISTKDKKSYMKVYPFYDYYNSLSDDKKIKYKKEFIEVFNRIFESECSIEKEYIIGKW